MYSSLSNAVCDLRLPFALSADPPHTLPKNRKGAAHAAPFPEQKQPIASSPLCPPSSAPA
jgi:hypothetical protein